MQAAQGQEMVRTVIHRVIECHAAATPEAIACVDARRSVSYRELNATANAVARHLMAGGVRRTNVVMVCLPRSTDLAAVLLAVLKTGAAYCWIDPADGRLPVGVSAVQGDDDY